MGRIRRVAHSHASSEEPVETVLERCRAQAQDLFQPVFSELHREDFQVIVALEKLLDRLEKFNGISN
jgi:hypothetical protein